MDVFFGEISKPSWWFSVVVAGILVNIVSTYIKSTLDRSISSTATWWQRSSEVRMANWIAYVASLSKSPKRIAQTRHQEIRLRISVAIYLMFALTFFAISHLDVTFRGQVRRESIGVLALASMFWLLAFLTSRDAARKARAVEQAIGGGE